MQSANASKQGPEEERQTVAYIDRKDDRIAQLVVGTDDPPVTVKEGRNTPVLTSLSQTIGESQERAEYSSSQKNGNFWTVVVISALLLVIVLMTV